MKKPSFVTFWTLASALGLAAAIPAQSAVRVAPKADAQAKKVEAQDKAKKEKSAEADLQRRLKELVGLLENDELSDKERAMARKTLAEAIKELGRKDNTFVWSTQAPKLDGMIATPLGAGTYAVTEKKDKKEGQAPAARRVIGLGTGAGGGSVAERVAKARHDKEHAEREVAEVAEAPKARRIAGSGTGGWVIDTTKDNVRWLELAERQKKAAVEQQKAAKEQALVLERVKAQDLRARAVELQKAATENRVKADEMRKKAEVLFVERAKQDHAAEVRREVERALVRSSQSPRGRRIAVREVEHDDDAEIREMIQQMRNEMREIRDLLRQMQNQNRPRATGMGGLVPPQAPAAPAPVRRMMVRETPPQDTPAPAAAPAPRTRTMLRRAPSDKAPEAPAAGPFVIELEAPAAAETPAEPTEPAPPAEPRLRRLMR